MTVLLIIAGYYLFAKFSWELNHKSDQELLQEVMNDLRIPNMLRFFDTCKKGLDYLITTIERPFLIISDINLPLMTGIEFKIAINNHEELKRKNIPFIFLSTNPDQKLVSEAYQLFLE